MKHSARYAALFVLLLFLLSALFCLNLLSGSVSLSAREVFSVLRGTEAGERAARIVRDWRLPRALAAAALGGALALSGFLMQTFFANPIAGPFVLGVSSGAKLTVALTMILALRRGVVLSAAEMIAAAFVGSAVVMGFILLASSRIHQMSLLVVCGVMVGYVCSAATDFAVTFASDANIVNLHEWSMGSFSGIGWERLGPIAAVTLPALACCFLLAKPMSAYQLGETYAQNLGVTLRRFRAELILLASILAACVTAFAGPVSFVGIAAPHLMRRLFGTEKPIVLIPACYLGGAAFCLLCDLLARTLFAPTEMSISSVTAVFGAPVVIAMLLRRGKER